jgi:surfeit locus 1 family protein
MGARLRQLILPGFLTLIVFAALVSLGNWQVRRLAWKEDLIARATERPKEPAQDLPPASAWAGLDIADSEYRPYRLSGRFLHDKEALVFTSLSEPKGRYGGPGFWVVTPFALPGGGTVLVNRGFAPQGRERPANRGETLSDAPTTVVGLLRPDDTPNMFTPADRPDLNVFYARHIAAISAAKGLPAPVAPFTIDLLAPETPPGGLPQAGETLFAFPNNHLQYAITWYGLAVVLLAVFAGFAWTCLRGPMEESSR